MSPGKSSGGFGGRAASSSIRFGTDGWRAIIVDEFTLANVELVTQGFADTLRERPGSVILGFDRRKLSPEAAEKSAEVLAGNGIPVQLASSHCPTPCIAWETKTRKARAGMMITASHNPPEWNGIKFKEEDGGAASPEYTTAVEQRVARIRELNRRPKLLSLREARHQGLVTAFDPHRDYVQALQKMVDIEKIRRAGWKIGYDPLFGAGVGFMGRILETDLVEIHGQADTSFGGLNPEPIEKNLSDLIHLIKERRLDVGFATDGDADRIGAVDESGRFVDSHHIFALILRHLVTVGKETGDVVKTVSTSTMIDRLAEQHHLKLHETPIGFKHICKKFRTLRPLAGGEESGGIAVGRWMIERDGLFATLLLLDIMTHHGKKLGELVEDLHREVGPHFFAREDLHLTPSEMEKVRSDLAERSPDQIAGEVVLHVNRTDGIKYTLSRGSWLLIRPSGTEPVLRIYVESSSPEQMSRVLREGKNLL